MAPALIRLKTLIWVHAFIGAAFVVAFFAFGLQTGSEAIIGGILACGLLWLLALLPMRKMAERLGPVDRGTAKGLPTWVLAVWAVGEVTSLYHWGYSDWTGVMFGVHVLAGITLFLRAFLHGAFGVPMNGLTWAASVANVGVGTMGYLFCGFMRAVAGC